MLKSDLFFIFYHGYSNTNDRQRRLGKEKLLFWTYSEAREDQHSKNKMTAKQNAKNTF